MRISPPQPSSPAVLRNQKPFSPPENGQSASRRPLPIPPVQEKHLSKSFSQTPSSTRSMGTNSSHQLPKIPSNKPRFDFRESSFTANLSADSSPTNLPGSQRASLGGLKTSNNPPAAKPTRTSLFVPKSTSKPNSQQEEVGGMELGSSPSVNRGLGNNPSGIATLGKVYSGTGQSIKAKASEPDFLQKGKPHGFGSPSVFTRLRANSHSQIDPKSTKPSLSRSNLNGKSAHFPTPNGSPKSLGKEKTKPEKPSRSAGRAHPIGSSSDQSKLSTPPKSTHTKGATNVKPGADATMADGPTNLLQAQYHTSATDTKPSFKKVTPGSTNSIQPRLLTHSPAKYIGPTTPSASNIARKNLTPKASPTASPITSNSELRKSASNTNGNAYPNHHASSPQTASGNDSLPTPSKLAQSKLRSTPNKMKPTKSSGIGSELSGSTMRDSPLASETKSSLGLTNIKVPSTSGKGHSMISTPVKEMVAKSGKPFSNQSPIGGKSNPSSRTSSVQDISGVDRSMSSLEISTKAMDPLTVLKANVHKLSLYERGEILEYPRIYFYGENIVKKPVKGDGNTNFGYDDERGDYQIVLHDHLIYRYEVLEILGKGSFGQVIKAFDHKTDQVVAIKMIRNKSRFHTQALIEVKILESIRKWDPDDAHNLVHMHDHFYFRNHLCIAFELLSINLYEFIKSNSFKGCSINLIRRFTIQIIRALTLLSKHRVIHCDLKPENILLKSTSKSAIKVIDLGSSCLETELGGRPFLNLDGTPKVVINSKGKRRYPGTRPLTQVLKCTDEPFLDFITRCLEWDPEKRIKPDEAMQHRWIQATSNDARLVQPRSTTPRTNSNPTTPQHSRKLPAKSSKDFKYTSPHVTPCASRNQAESASAPISRTSRRIRLTPTMLRASIPRTPTPTPDSFHSPINDTPLNAIYAHYSIE
ncbi:hypothetical protein K493DRAFT_302966 [Basidiobolus meristosporus CBS 931.73]|uniref:dual-specificity kinase n=1 Tax=Basidiobolus meristosporus CBS 931.73 TaxID=1314790 RepID=A0A1Y1Y4S8_9FUNG|nr:hypothetical protein K493DRAFT_302966 [Basidiobolus meristosporus CBS 931.73]|eukprot:ORX92997.1 hypothetical protein K493DRAFT_302966 [Basidiobolus meristosporus CBS 931.73]